MYQTHALEYLYPGGAEEASHPVWSRRDLRLWWIDSAGQTLNRLDPMTGVNRSFPLPESPRALALADYGLLLVFPRGIHHFDPLTGALTLLRAWSEREQQRRITLGRVDSAGNFWLLATPADDALLRFGLGNQLLRYDGSQLQTLEPPTDMSHGLAFAPPGDRLYWLDRRRQVVWFGECDVVSGAVRHPQLIRQLQGIAGTPVDGVADAAGNYWLLMQQPGRLLQLNAQGDILRQLELPGITPTMLSFGGPRLDQLFITTSAGPEGNSNPGAGAVLRLYPGVQGRAEPLYVLQYQGAEV